MCAPLMHAPACYASQLGRCAEDPATACRHRLVHLQIDGDAPENQNPTQSDEDRKLGVTHEWLPVAGLAQQLYKFEREGYGIFAGLYSIAHGLQLRETLGL